MRGEEDAELWSWRRLGAEKRSGLKTGPWGTPVKLQLSEGRVAGEDQADVHKRRLTFRPPNLTKVTTFADH